MSNLGGNGMYKNRNQDGSNNLCGGRVKQLRLRALPKLSQRARADALQLKGLDLDKNAIQRIECGKRFVTDIDLKAFADYFGVPADLLLSDVPIK